MSSNYKITYIVWDLGGTLLLPSERDCPSQSLLVYIYGGKLKPSRLDKLALTIFDKLGIQKNSHNETVRLSTGEPVPQIICSLLAGTISNQEAYQKVTDLLNSQPELLEALTSSEKSDLQAMLRDTFNPEILARLMHPIDSGISILSYASGLVTIKNRYILSNWDRESFKILSSLPSGEKIATYFVPSNILISAYTGSIKPQKNIYHYFFKHYNLNPQQGIFIDNQQENIDAAQEFGMHGLLFKDSPETINYIKCELTRLFGL